MTVQEETQLTSARAVTTARHAAQLAALASQAAHHNANRLFLDALARPACARIVQDAQRAQTHAALAEQAAANARTSLHSLLAAERAMSCEKTPAQ